MLSGKLPFTGDTESATWKNITTGDFPPLPSHISQDVKKLVNILLAKSPERRPEIDQIIITKLVTRYVKLIVGYGRMAKNQYDLLKDNDEEEKKEEKPAEKKQKSTKPKVSFKLDEKPVNPTKDDKPTTAKEEPSKSTESASRDTMKKAERPNEVVKPAPAIKPPEAPKETSMKPPEESKSTQQAKPDAVKQILKEQSEDLAKVS